MMQCFPAPIYVVQSSDAEDIIDLWADIRKKLFKSINGDGWNLWVFITYYFEMFVVFREICETGPKMFIYGRVSHLVVRYVPIMSTTVITLPKKKYKTNKPKAF